MAEENHPKPQQNLETTKPKQQEPTKARFESYKNGSYSGQKAHFPNPAESVNPDPATLRDQWRFAIRQYSKWYSHAWGTAILAGGAFFALGWFIKGGNPLPSKKDDSQHNNNPHPDVGK
ncbi:uncharacterized protein LOC141642959 [Silene latifolia]|uniref:uncharacterized protein LOC141642959 n=1 Tax=Silene latifolia TaxID=37657 RepID=UPI003D7808D5